VIKSTAIKGRNMKLREYKKIIDDLYKRGHGEKIVIRCIQEDDDEDNLKYRDVYTRPEVVTKESLGLNYEGRAENEAVLICID
jgi:hypothetical protein